MKLPKKTNQLATGSGSQQVSEFLDKARQLQTRAGDGRLIFALDATASRQATWDRACHLQAQMFDATASIAGLTIQLCYYRGSGEFNVLPWSGDSHSLRQQMLSVQCLGGFTQIEKLLRHGLAQHRKSTVRAMVFVGDAMEENSQSLYQLAGQMGIHRLPVFMFQEGFDPTAGQVFTQIARLSGGVHCQFDENSEQQLRDLLRAVAVYASGGVAAVAKLEQSPQLQHLLQHLPRR